MDKPLRVLYLEDDCDFTSLVATMLKNEGLHAEVEAVGDFPSFAAALETDTLDIILADYLLPGCNGIQALHAARTKRPETPFLLVSGAIGEQAAIESLQSGVTDYVLKTRLDRLVPAMRRALSEAQERAERRRIETELVRREKYFRTLTENSLDVLTILSADGIFQYNSPSARTVLGYDPNELAGRNAFELIHPEDVLSARQALGQALQNPGLRVTHQFRFRHRSGTWCYLESVGQNRLEDPQVGGLVLNSRDISDRIRAEAEVRESEKQYRLIFEGNPVPMWISDLSTYAFLEVNEAALKQYGYSREELLLMTTKDIRPPDEAERLVKYFGDVANKQPSSGVGHAGLWRHCRKNGSIIAAEITWSLIAFKGREALLTMAQDVTERSRNERREAGLSKLSRGLSSATSAHHAAHIIKEVTDELFGWDCFALGLYAPETDSLRPVLKINTVKGQRQEIHVDRVREKPDAIVRRIMEKGAELLSDPALIASIETGLFGSRAQPGAAQVLVPVRNGTKVIAILSIQSFTPGAYSPQDLNALQILADHCAGALERIHAEQALRESERRFRELFEGSPDAIIVVDLDARILDVNPAACRLWSANADRLVGQNIAALAPGHRKQEIVSALAGFVTGALSRSEETALTADGREVPIEASGNCIEYGGKQAVLLHVRDITERKHAAEALQKSEASLVAAQRIAHIGSWELDLVNPDDIHKNELRWSDETFRIFGLEPRKVAVSTELFFRFVHPEDRQRIAEISEQAVRNRGTYDTEHRIVLGNGEERIVRERAELAFDATGRPVQMRGTVMDITERKHLEEQLRQSQKLEAIGQLAGGVAHDFNNILTVMHGHASLMLEDKGLSDTSASSARQITRSVERAAGLTRQLLTFSRRQVIQPRQLDLNEVVSNMTMMLGRILGEDIALQLNYWSEPAFIRADMGMVEQVLLNLAVNARDAMPEGGQLAIKISMVNVTASQLGDRAEARPGPYVCLSVIDNGCGITPENLRRIFEPFFTTKEVGKGTGLGLATVYGIVKQHHGWIEVESEPGHGAAFRVFLPASRKADGPLEDEPETRPVRGGGETILVVEDETPVRDLTCSVLQKYGYHVLQAESGARALELWTQTKPRVDLLLTDLVMPDRVNGRELAEKLREQQPSLKVIFTSGYSADIVGKDLVLRRGLYYLQKPYGPLKLALTVRDCLDAPAQA
jgi:PAS domain S-box-containing protein